MKLSSNHNLDTFILHLWSDKKGIMLTEFVTAGTTQTQLL